MWTSVVVRQEVWFLYFSKYSTFNLCVRVCVGRPARLWREGEVRDARSLCKYAEHGGILAGAEGVHGVAELIYLMTERLISPQPWLESMLDEGSDRGVCTAPRPYHVRW